MVLSSQWVSDFVIKGLMVESQWEPRFQKEPQVYWLISFFGAATVAPLP